MKLVVAKIEYRRWLTRK